MILIALNVTITAIDLILHIICISLLWRYDQAKEHSFIISVLLSETLMGLWHVIRMATPITYAFEVANVCRYTVNIPYCGGLILLTLERYMEVYLHIKYYTSFFYLHRLKFSIALWVTMALMIIYIALSLHFQRISFVFIQHINDYCILTIQR